jgi:hypothetical protein
LNTVRILVEIQGLGLKAVGERRRRIVGAVSPQQSNRSDLGDAVKTGHDRDNRISQTSPNATPARGQIDLTIYGTITDLQADFLWQSLSTGNPGRSQSDRYHQRRKPFAITHQQLATAIGGRVLLDSLTQSCCRSQPSSQLTVPRCRTIRGRLYGGQEIGRAGFDFPQGITIGQSRIAGCAFEQIRDPGKGRDHHHRGAAIVSDHGNDARQITGSSENRPTDFDN